MPYSSPKQTPISGDVVLRRTNDAFRRYTLSTSAEVPQIACNTHKDAVAQARRFAQSRRVDVWETDDDRTFARIVERRMVRSA